MDGLTHGRTDARVDIQTAGVWALQRSMLPNYAGQGAAE